MMRRFLVKKSRPWAIKSIFTVKKRTTVWPFYANKRLSK
ncbi:Uncharacterised protein [Vibrio cholerae]|nr:Uncharacterised protein [Vibrio cholerae]